jgi:hypothetical protein
VVGGQIKNKTVTLLLSLLEGVESDFIPSRILEALEVDAIVKEINYQQVFHFLVWSICFLIFSVISLSSFLFSPHYLEFMFFLICAILGLATFYFFLLFRGSTCTCARTILQGRRALLLGHSSVRM